MRLNELRDACGMTQFQLSHILKIDQTTISKWESGKSKPRFEQLARLAEIFNVGIEQIMTCFNS